MLRLIRKLLKGFAFSFIIGCGFSEQQPAETAPAKEQQIPAPKPKPPGERGGNQSISFLADIKPILDEHCALTGCHGVDPFASGSEFIDFDGPRRIKNGTMPPRYSPKFDDWTDEDKQLILEWIDENI
jgi:hypothetical protein